MPVPELREDDVLIQIHAAGVNPLDFKIRDGEFKLILPYRLPLILGNDAAGVVVRVGSRVRRFKPGDEVYARPHKDRIGTFAEFIAVKEDVGATVATTASAGNAEWVKQLGADIVIDYKKDDFAAVLKDCDVVLDTQGGNTLERSLRVLKPGGKLIGIAGPPDLEFAKETGASWVLRTAVRFLSYRIRKAAKRHSSVDLHLTDTVLMLHQSYARAH